MDGQNQKKKRGLGAQFNKRKILCRTLLYDQDAIAYEDAILRRKGEHWLADGEPEVWAQYRHALVRGLEWYNNAEAGVMLSAKVKGSPHDPYLMGLFVNHYTSIYSYFDAEVLIVSDANFANINIF